MRRRAIVAGGLAAVLVALIATLWPRVPSLPPIGPTDPVCQSIMANRAPDVVLVSEIAALFERGRIPDVPFGQLPAHDGSVVRVTGFMVGDLIFPSREFAVANRMAHGISTRMSVAFPQKAYFSTRGAAITERCARIEGRLAWGGLGAPDSCEPYDGVMIDLLRVEVWSEPERPIIWNLPPSPSDLSK